MRGIYIPHTPHTRTKTIFSTHTRELSANRRRVRRDLRLYAKWMGPEHCEVESERLRVKRLVERRLPARLARLHAEEGDDQEEAAEWTRLRRSKRADNPLSADLSPPPPVAAPPPAPDRPPQSSPQSSAASIRDAARTIRRAESVRAIRAEVMDVVSMARDLAFMVKEAPGGESKTIDTISQVASDARVEARASAGALQNAASSRASYRMRAVRVLTAATGVAAAIVFGGGFGSAAYVAGAVGFGAVAALA